MDLLTHLFLPLTVVYVLRSELFTHPAALALAGFGLVPDFDKFLGHPGLLHSAVTIVPLCAVAILAERFWFDHSRYGPVITWFVASHLVLDIVDGGPVPVLYPFFDQGLGLQYPARTVFGEGAAGVRIEGDVVSTRVVAPRSGFNTYTFIDAEGVAWMLAFLVIFFGLAYQDRTST